MTAVKLLTVGGFNALTTSDGSTPPSREHPPAGKPSAAAPVPGGHWDFRFPSHLAGLAGFNAQLEACLEGIPLSVADNFALHLLLDELLTNVIKYAHPGGGEHEIAVAFTVQAEHFEVCIQDDGVAFDPTTPPSATAAAQRPLPMEDRTVGGWGLSLVRRTADVLNYQRDGGKNHLRLRKRLTPGAPAGEPPPMVR